MAIYIYIYILVSLFILNNLRVQTVSLSRLQVDSLHWRSETPSKCKNACSRSVEYSDGFDG